MKTTFFTVAATMCMLIANPAAAENIDPDNSDRQFSYSENVGWFNADPATITNAGIDVDDTAISGYIWAENIGWISLSCENTETCNTVDYRVVNDGAGNLYGYGWSENTGWINFSCTTNNTCANVKYGISIDPATGDFSGRAWGENIGWISFDYATYTDYYIRTAWRINGDIGGDGTVTLADAIIVLKVSAGQAAPTQIYVGADVDGDNRLGIEESIFILNRVAGM